MGTVLQRFAILFLALAVASCGGGGGPTTSMEPATVGVLITDAPVGKWDEAIATITRVTLIGDDGQVTLFSGSQTLDLLKLGDFSELFAVNDDVPPGTYSKIRLQLSDLVLNDVDPATGSVIESVQPQLVGNGKIDLNPRGSFDVRPGDTVFVRLDFDMDKSLKITETGNGKLIVRPVVFVDITTEHNDGRLSRVHGEINAIDADAGTLELCQTAFASQWDEEPAQLPSDPGRCLLVTTDASTGIFDADGQPQAFADLAVGEEATVVGRLRRLTDAEDDGSGRLFALDALVIEEGALGTFSRIRGTVASAVDVISDRFGLDVAPGQGIATDAPLPVQLYAQTRFFDRSGAELSRDDVTVGRAALVDGVLAIGADDVLRSPLVMLGDLVPPGDATLEGTVVSIDAAAHSLVVNDGTMDRCVDASAADVFLVSDADGFSTTQGDLGDLVAGQGVAVFGTENGGCLVADTIIAQQ
jgi:hypothetical protein